MELQMTLLDLLKKTREEQVALSVEAEGAKDDMLTIHRNKTITFSSFPQIANAVDPKTNKSNKEWSQFLLDQLLEQDEEYMEALGNMYRFQTQLAQVNNEVLDLVERLNVTKTQCRLIAAMLDVVKDMVGM